MYSIMLHYIISIIIIPSLITSTLANTTAINCGQPNSKLLMLNGKTTSSETMPWNVAIYKNDHNNYNLICGGTLIAPNIVISVAFCLGVVEEVGYSNNIVKNIGQYKVAVGKYTRDITILDHILTQIVDISFVYIKEEYTGNVDSFTNDIAVVVLATSVRLGDGVMPICVDWSSQYKIRNGVIGKLAGWGRTNTIDKSIVLSIPYIERPTCLHMYKRGFQKYITKDKFCAGSKSDPELLIGGGAGLIFSQRGSYYLTGVFSIKDQENKDSVAVYSDVRYHVTWIFDIYLNHTNTNCKVDNPTVHDCGKPSTRLLMLNGKIARSELMPWNVAIYKNDKNKYNMICGGTLIAPKLVISVAHCFGEDGISDNVLQFNGQFIIAVGKYTKDISIMDHLFTQIIDVKFVYIVEDDSGSARSYANDLAVLELTADVRMSNGIMPVCIDWIKQFTVQNGLIGKIAGWGRMNNMVENSILSLPYIDRQTCLQMYKNGFQRYVTKDTFCAGSKSDKGLNVGYGAGLTFTRRDLYFLSGVFTLKEAKSEDSIAVYLDVSYHIKSLHDIYTEYNTPTLSNCTSVNTSDLDQQNCKISQFLCNSGKCINAEFMCDGIKDCNDGSDENPTMCKTRINVNNVTTLSPTMNSQVTATWPTTKKQCVIQNTEGSIYSYKYSYTDRNDALLPGTKVEQSKLVYEHCEEGYYKVETYRFKLCAETGNWEPPISDTLCLKMCPPMSSNSLEMRCSYNGKDNNCSKPSVPGTKLKPRCKPLHNLPNGREEMPIELTCLSDGKWSEKLYSCIPDCGRLKPKLLILNGDATSPTSVPWNVAVYKNNYRDYELICGGTLIASNLVVSAAHCFWQEDLSSNFLLTNNGEYKVAVGKYTRDISIIDDSFTQIIDVKSIYMEEDYFGLTGSHSNDIAIIVLSTNVSMGDSVLPVCVDWFSKYSIQSDSIGKIAGWGITEKNVTSPVLLEAKLQYIDRLTCRRMFTKGFQRYITKDKFCAGSKSGQGVNSGDSGSGLTFIQNDSYFLTGITSVKEGDDSNISVAAFTNVSSHINWIRSVYTRHANTNTL